MSWQNDFSRGYLAMWAPFELLPPEINNLIYAWLLSYQQEGKRKSWISSVGSSKNLWKLYSKSNMHHAQQSLETFLQVLRNSILFRSKHVSRASQLPSHFSNISSQIVFFLEDFKNSENRVEVPTLVLMLLTVFKEKFY